MSLLTLSPHYETEKAKSIHLAFFGPLICEDHLSAMDDLSSLRYARLSLDPQVHFGGFTGSFFLPNLPFIVGECVSLDFAARLSNVNPD